MEFNCEVCGKEAEFDSPADLCEEHWKLWWYSGVLGDCDPWEFPNANKEEREFYIKIKRDGQFLEIETTDAGKVITFCGGKVYN